MDIGSKLRLVRSALYVPASNVRAMEKARALDADMLIIDLEDAVAEENKSEARAAAIAATQQAGFPDKLVALRINGRRSLYFADDLATAAQCAVDAVVLPKVEDARELDVLPCEMIAMVETPAGVFAAQSIARHPATVALIAGTNDIAAETGIRPGPRRQGLEMALQTIVMAAAIAGKPAFDGVYNRLDDPDGLQAECLQGRCYGFTGKTVIHPGQIAITNLAFSPTIEELADARELVAAARGGAQRFQGRMIEAMHVEDAKRIIERAGRATGTGE
jgi:citrate lyase subunit beta/citryl-CoA lyase